MTDESKRWVEAGKQLGADPRAVVKCPRCAGADLTVEDVVFEADPARFERILRCPKCGAMNALLMRRR